MNLNIYTYDDWGAGWRAGSWAGWLNKRLSLRTNTLGISQTQNTLASGQTPQEYDKTQTTLELEQTP